MFNNRIKIFVAIIVCSFCFWPKLSLALTITPLILEVELDPGQQAERLVAVYNETDQDMYLTGAIETFKPKGDQGGVDILSSDLTNASINWLKLSDNSILLPAHKTAKVPVIFNIPKTATVGGYYLAAMWQTSSGPKRPGSQINISSRVGTLILLKVRGEVKEELALKSLRLEGDNWQFAFGPALNKFVKENNIFQNDQLTLVSSVTNHGNVHLKPQGYIIVKNIFGRVIMSLPFNGLGNNILPQSDRQFTDNLSTAEIKPANIKQAISKSFASWRLGRYSVRLAVEYGENRQALESAEIYFWLLPPLSLLAVLVVIILILIFIFICRRRKK